MKTTESQALRILIIVEPGIDGVFRHVEGLVHFLIGRNQRVHLAYSDVRGSPELLKLVAYVREHGGECLNLRVSNGPQPGDVRALAQLWKFARRFQPQIIHSHSSKAGVLGRTLAFLGLKGRQFYTPHAYYGLAGRPGLKFRFYNGIERFFGMVGRTINISDDERAFAVGKLRIPAERCVAIHNPVDTDKFVPVTPEQKRAQRQKLNIPENAVVLGSMGRLSFQKDPQTLYKAFALAREKGIDLHLVHVGQGELAPEMESLAKNLKIESRLIRFPYFNQPSEFYSVLDAFIMTSRYEAGWPIVILEALACGLPVISSTGAGTSTIQNAGLSHCWSAPVGEAGAFAARIEEWQQDRKLNRPSNHRAIALERFSPEKCFGSVLKCYQSA